MRKFSYITVGAILERLNDAGLHITRATYYRLAKLFKLPDGRKTRMGWRIYTPTQAEEIVAMFKKEYSIE